MTRCYEAFLGSVCAAPSQARPRRLIITADDFGDTPEVNAAVLKAYREGVLRFASLMVRRPAAAAAAAIARENPGLGVGLHLELCAAAPASAGLRYFFDPRARAGLEGEIRGQIETLLAFGLRPTHIDGHINVHVHPTVFPAVCRLARQYAIPRVRLPAWEATLAWEALKDFPGGVNIGAALQAVVFAVMGAWVRGATLARGAASGLEVPRSWGLLRSGLMSEDYALRLIGRLPEGTTELYFHPTTDESLRADGRPTPSHQSVCELETLLSPRVRRAIAEGAIDLVSARP